MSTMTPLQRKFENMRQELKRCLVGREKEIDLLLTAMLCNEHVLFIGPPGTGKSMLCNAICKAISGKSFAVLMGQHTEPDEVFGPVSVAAYKKDKRERMIDGYAADADLIILDEVWKANSAIINSLLTLMNERRFKNGTNWMNAPLRTAVGASNEWPVGEDFQIVSAAFDRFLFRMEVMPVDKRHRKDLIFHQFPEITPGQFTTAEMDEAAEEASNVSSAGVVNTLLELIDTLENEGVYIGDRRMRKSLDALCASAWLNGRNQVELEDFAVLQFILWDDPQEQMKIARKTILAMANPNRAEAETIFAEAQEIITNSGFPKLTGESNEHFAALKKLANCLKRVKALGREAKEEADYIEDITRKFQIAAIGGDLSA